MGNSKVQINERDRVQAEADARIAQETARFEAEIAALEEQHAGESHHEVTGHAPAQFRVGADGQLESFTPEIRKLTEAGRDFNAARLAHKSNLTAIEADRVVALARIDLAGAIAAAHPDDRALLGQKAGIEDQIRAARAALTRANDTREQLRELCAPAAAIVVDLLGGEAPEFAGELLKAHEADLERRIVQLEKQDRELGDQLLQRGRKRAAEAVENARLAAEKKAELLAKGREVKAALAALEAAEG